MDTILRDGGNSRKSDLRVAAYFMKGKSVEENAAFLAREYRSGGKGYQFGEAKISVWFDENSLTVGKGNSALQAKAREHISWEQAAAHIRGLLEKGEYISADRLDEAIDNEHRELANKLLFFYRDDLRDFRDIPEGWRTEKGGFPDDVENIKTLIDDPATFAEISARVEQDITALSTDPDAPKRFWHRPGEVLRDIRDSGLQNHPFPGQDLPPANISRFITEDEIDTYLSRGSGYESGKFSIFSFYMHDHNSKEKADFLKQSYGHGGHSHALSGADDSWADAEPGKGIILRRGGLSEPYDTVKLSWSVAAKRIGKLIDEGKYMSDEDISLIPEYEKRTLARQIVAFYDYLPDDIERPFPGEDSFGRESQNAVRDMLDQPEQVEKLIASMALVMEGTHPDDRRHDMRLTAFQNITAYRDGAFTLFPNLKAAPELLSIPKVSVEQMSFFAEAELLPTLPSVEQQQVGIEEAERREEIATAENITREDIDEVLLRGLDSPEAHDRHIAQFTDNPRSREAAMLVRELYGKLGGTNGLTVSKGDISEVVPWPKVHKRVAELAQEGRFLDEQNMPVQKPNMDFHAADLNDIHLPPDVRDLLSDELLSPDFKNVIADMVSLGATNAYIGEHLSEAFDRLSETFMLSAGYEADYFTDRNGIRIEAQDRYLTKTSITWEEAASVCRALANEGLDGFLTTEQIAAREAGKAEPSSPEIADDDELTTQTDIDTAAPEPVILSEQDAIDNALREWNGDTESKLRVYNHMQEHGRERGTADFLRNEYGGNLPSFPIAAAQMDMPWPRVQQRIGQLIGAENFLASEEKTQLVSVDAVKLRDIVIDLSPRDPFASPELPTVKNYQLGDTVILEDDRQFVIDSVSDTGVSLQDITFQNGTGFPIFRSLGIAEFERLLQQYPQQEITSTLSPTENYRIVDEHLGEGGPKTRFAANVAAIRTLKQIESESRAATPDEQEILAHYVGWGGIPQAFDAENSKWEREYSELKDLLTPEEYDMARASTLNAHFTSPTVIKAMYDAVERMGFRSGNLLEPSCGVGNFFGLLPDSMSSAKLYGVELDSVTGRIATLLYPQANIQVKGFEKTSMPDAFFDVAIGNIPFGDYPIVDKKYKQNFSIHDYFFAKTLDQVRPGGVVAFVTSKYTMDKRDSTVRKYIAQRADLLGAVRLPSNAFLKNAGTEVTADILFLQKRDRPLTIEPDWVHLGENGDGIPMNRYFVEHPEMVLGRMDFSERMHGNKQDTACLPIPGADLAEQLRDAMANIEGHLTRQEMPDLDDLADMEIEAIPADPDVKNYSYTVVDERVYYRENSEMYPVELPATTLDRIRGMVALRDCVHELIDMQLYDYGEADIKAQQRVLDGLYDAFTTEFGLINSSANSKAFSADSAYFLLSSLEVLDENGELERKADMFAKRTIKQHTPVASVDTASEALAVSIGERARVDMDFMSELSGLSQRQLLEDLHGVVFLNIGHADSPEKAYVTADEYLSGNVREKLAAARAAVEVDPSLSINVEALEKAQPKDLEASEISVRLGSTWIDKSYYQQFMYELLQTPYNLRRIAEVNHSKHTGEWFISSKTKVPRNDVAAYVTYGTNRKSAYDIIEETLNLRDVRVYDLKQDEEGREKRVLNKKETTLAQQKQEQIKQAFKDWIWNDPERRKTLTRLYNERFNSNRPREYDGSHLIFSGISPDITLRPHQRSAIARILYGGNTLLAHEVGAGKTFEMVAAAMEGKRLGLCNKSLFAVPNHLSEQLASEFLRLYPSANVLVATKRDFQMRNRKKFCAKIATGDYDAVIIGHSQLEKIPISQERQERLLHQQLEEVMQGIDELRSSHAERFSVKQLERTRKRLLARLEKLQDGKKRDDVVTFEQLGVDRLFVDEAHNFKNLYLYTKMCNVAGLSQSESQKSSDLFMKCRYMDELTGGKGIIYATGTPISNSVSEMYTMQRYLQYDTIADAGLSHFDSWASTFGETATAVELAPEGTGYRARTRFSKFHNLPELMCMFSDVADIKTADSLDLPRPKANYETILVKPSELQTEMVAALSERATAVHGGNVDPSCDNMLKITSDGRKIGLDQRLIDPLLPDEAGSKVNACMENIHRIWESTQDKRLTQLCFCDFSTPTKDGRFNVYDDIRNKLIDKGIPESEIAFIHDADTEAKKKELFAKVRKGQVRVLFGSTFKLGAGTNIQDRLIAMHDLDCPWRPADLEQRAGRIVRQGNQNPEVHIYRYVTESTFDAYLYQTVENKQKFISQIMSSKSPMRSCDDVDESALNYAEIKALCTGNPLIKEKMDLDIEVARLRLLKSDYKSQHYRLEDDLITAFPKSIELTKGRIEGLEKDMQRIADNMPKAPEGASADKAPFPAMTIQGTVHHQKETAGKALLEACKAIKGSKVPVPIGSYLGFDMSLSFDAFDKAYALTLKGDMSYNIRLGADTFGNITRINNELKFDLPQQLEVNRIQLENLYQQVESAKVELEKPFPLEQELAEKEMRLALVNADLNIDGEPKPLDSLAAVAATGVPVNEAITAKRKPSVLESLRAHAKKEQPLSRTDKNKDIAR